MSGKVIRPVYMTREEFQNWVKSPEFDPTVFPLFTTIKRTVNTRVAKRPISMTVQVRCFSTGLTETRPTKDIPNAILEQAGEIYYERYAPTSLSNRLKAVKLAAEYNGVSTTYDDYFEVMWVVDKQ